MKTIQQKVMAFAVTTAIFFGGMQLKAQTTVIDNLEVAATEALKVAGGTTINNLTVRADKTSCGQLIIESGVIEVKRMTYKLTVPPAEWIMIALPTEVTNLNSPEASNLAALGILQDSGTKRYSLKTYDASRRANNLEPWVAQKTPDIKAHTAYLIYLSGIGTEPVELEFYFDNQTLDPTKTTGEAIIDLDLTGKLTQQTYPVKIKAANARSNTLDVAVYNDPEATPAPINYQNAVDEAKIYFTEDNTAFRISLPNSEPCKTLILDNKMKKVFRAIEYISPAAIPLSGLKRGTYKVYIEYGGAVAIKELKKK